MSAETIFLWIAICTGPDMTSCSVGTFFKSDKPDAVFECAKQEEIAAREYRESGAYIKHACKTLEEFERDGL